MWGRVGVLLVATMASGCFIERGGTGGGADAGPDRDGSSRSPDAGACPGIDLQTDPDHCGECANACLRVPSGVPTCVDGRCGLSCGAGHADCDGRPETGCEVLTDRNPEHCGACDTRCDAASPPPNMVAAGCVASRCAFDCAPGFGDCDGDEANGCEVDLRNTRDSCGRCGFTCPLAAHSQPLCVGGECTVRCDSPRYLDCNGLASDGCERDAQDDLACGVCSGDFGNICVAARCTCDGAGCRCVSILP